MSAPVVAGRAHAALLRDADQLAEAADLLLGELQDTQAFLTDVLASAHRLREQARQLAARLVDGPAAGGPSS